MSRPRLCFWLRLLLLGQLLPALMPLCAQDSKVVSRSAESQQIPGPKCAFIPDWDTGRARLCTPAERAVWLADVQHWRSKERLRIGDGGKQSVGR